MAHHSLDAHWSPPSTLSPDSLKCLPLAKSNFWEDTTMPWHIQRFSKSPPSISMPRHTHRSKLPSHSNHQFLVPNGPSCYGPADLSIDILAQLKLSTASMPNVASILFSLLTVPTPTLPYAKSQVLLWLGSSTMSFPDPFNTVGSAKSPHCHRAKRHQQD